MVPSKRSKESVIAFDTGPGNMVIDEVCQRLFHVPYDQNGWIASQGVVVDEILTYCMNHPFLNMKPPKSTGREQFGEAFVTELLNRFKSIVKKIYWQLSRCLQHVQLFIIIRRLFCRIMKLMR